VTPVGYVKYTAGKMIFNEEQTRELEIFVEVINV
jgi:hypothetical protein